MRQEEHQQPWVRSRHSFDPISITRALVGEGIMKVQFKCECVTPGGRSLIIQSSA